MESKRNYNQELKDASETLYKKVLLTKVVLLEENLEIILNGKFKSYQPIIEGNYNSKKDFEKMCEINLCETLTFKEAINRLMAFTHGNFNNAYFLDEKGRKIFTKINIESDNDK